MSTLTTLLDGRRIIAVLRARTAADYAPVITALVNGGVSIIELTLTTPGTLDALPSLVSTFENSATLGIGTVLTPDDARTAITAGAQFIISPCTNPQVISTTKDCGAVSIPGALTPTEVDIALRSGADAIKIFPAQTVGAQYLKHLHGPFPGLEGIPSGGIDVDGARQWLAAGSPAVSVGGPLLGDVFSSGDSDALATRTAAFLEAVESAGTPTAAQN